MGRRPSYLNFDVSGYGWKSDIDYKKHRELYRVGKGEQGVLICEPYKSEIGQYWRFKTSEIAKERSIKIFALFEAYLNDGDFVGADMARKYLQMGYRGLGVMPTIREARNTMRSMIMRSWNVVPAKRKRPNPLRSFMSVGRLPSPIRDMQI